MDDNKRKDALSNALSQIEKQFGKGSVMRMSDVRVSDVETVSTGSLSLDIALGVGGLPRGRVIEIYGPESSGKTTLSLQVIAEMQKTGGVAAFVDAEHALDRQYAEKIGVDISELLLSQPSSGEEGLEITDMLVRSGAVDLVVIDSVAALTPKAEIEGDMGDSHMGLQARLMSQALRKLTANIKRYNTMVIFINQIRMKIGVMFGCFDYNSEVNLANGKKEKIGDIVTQKIPVQVLSFNRDNKKFESKRIVNWYDNGKTDAFLHFKVDSYRHGRKHQFACTQNHQLLTPEGYRSAGELQEGDKLMTTVPYYTSPVREQVIWGSLLGDGGLLRARSTSPDQEVQLRPYQLWKHSLLNQSPEVQNPSESPLSQELAVIEEVEASNTYALTERLKPLAIAIWYMDKGLFDNMAKQCAIDCRTMLMEKRQAIYQWFNHHHISPRLDSQGFFQFDREETQKLHKMIAPYVHPAMSDKLLPAMRMGFEPIRFKAQKVLRAVPMRILEIRRKMHQQPSHRFDLEIEDNHNYVVDGVVVHNSPETTTGGNALKFYASVRLDIRRIGSVKRGDVVVGNETRVKVIKNKIAPPFQEATFDILYGEGISRESEILSLGVDQNIVEKSGAWYSYKGEQVGQGKENARIYLKEHPEIADEIVQQVRDKLLIKIEPAKQVEQSEPSNADNAEEQVEEKPTKAAPKNGRRKR